MRSAGRPRDPGIQVALLTATQELLLEQGFDRLSVDSVASRAGVGKAAIYRRWTGKTGLVVAAVADLAQAPPVPDTGSLREDLLACGRAFVRTRRTQQILAGLMTAMVHEAELRAAARDAVGAPFSQLFRAVIARAVERGESPASIDLEAVSDLLPGLAFHRSAALGLPVDDTFVVRVVDHLLLPLLRHDRHTVADRSEVDGLR